MYLLLWLLVGETSSGIERENFTGDVPFFLGIAGGIAGGVSFKMGVLEIIIIFIYKK